MIFGDDSDCSIDDHDYYGEDNDYSGDDNDYSGGEKYENDDGADDVNDKSFPMKSIFWFALCTSDLARTSDVQRHSTGMVRFTNNLKTKIKSESYDDDDDHGGKPYNNCDNLEEDENECG